MLTRQDIYQVIAEKTGCSTGYVTQIDYGLRSKGKKAERIRTLLAMADAGLAEVVRKIKAA